LKRKLLAIIATIGVVGAVLATGVSSAGTTRAETTVTIRSQNGDLSGFVRSPRPGRCANHRKVVVFHQVGSEQDPPNDDRLGSDIASRNGDRYAWNTGNSGAEGKVYARVARTDFCKADTSRTIEA
jgi:hypothetical protein